MRKVYGGIPTEPYVPGQWKQYLGSENESRVIEYHQCGALLNDLCEELRKADATMRNLQK